MRPRSTRGDVWLEMTANELLSLAVNVASGWLLDDVGYGSAENADALRKMLAEVYDEILQANRRAVGRAAAFRHDENALQGLDETDDIKS